MGFQLKGHCFNVWSTLNSLLLQIWLTNDVWLPQGRSRSVYLTILNMVWKLMENRHSQARNVEVWWPVRRFPELGLASFPFFERKSHGRDLFPMDVNFMSTRWHTAKCSFGNIQAPDNYFMTLPFTCAILAKGKKIVCSSKTLLLTRRLFCLHVMLQFSPCKKSSQYLGFVWIFRKGSHLLSLTGFPVTMDPMECSRQTVPMYWYCIPFSLWGLSTE